MSTEIQKAVESGKLTPAQGSALERLTPGAYVLHKSWGFGQIDSVDFLLHQMTIHFKTKRGHSMQLQYAVDSLLPIAPDHILAQKAADLEGVRTRAKDNPVAFMQRFLQNYGGRSTPDQISQVLVPDVFPEPEFKRWWENTKKLMKKDGHFAINSKKTEPIVLREAAVSRVDEHLVAFTESRQLKDQIAALDRIIKDIAEFTDPAAQLEPIILAAEDAARKNVKLKTNEALQLVIARDELVEKAAGTAKGPNAPTIPSILREEARNLGTLLDQAPAAKLKRVLLALPEAFPEDWVGRCLALVTGGTSRVVGEAARLLQEQGKVEELRTALDRAIREHSIASPGLVWLCDKRERKGTYANLIHPRVLSAILTALEREQFMESRDRKLHDALLNDRELVTDLVADAEPEELREAMRKLLLSPVFEELNKRSLLGRIVRVHPELEGMITGDSGERQEALIVSWESLERRKAEFDELVNKKIPQNITEISIAREYGDLRENFEFKAAKEMQRVLQRRKAETERDLTLARGTDFANPDTTQVSIGTIVTLREIASGRIDVYQILGAWDSVPEQNIVSYKAGIAQALLGHKVGEHLEIATEHGDRQVEIVKIEAWKKAEN
ncbi:MAG TPA: GreA/GreB family elongation factor [Chthoniobacteraceae bacterium]|jgi:transcription elongation GreA/GreB family factor